MLMLGMGMGSKPNSAGVECVGIKEQSSSPPECLMKHRNPVHHLGKSYILDLGQISNKGKKRLGTTKIYFYIKIF